jgi:anti-sigma factor RsiW
MNCRSFEKLIALYVEGDLPGRKAEAVKDHLNACAQCRDFAQELKVSQAALKSLRQDTLDEAVFQTVRTRVLSSLGAGKVRLAFPVWRNALAACLLILLVVSFLKLRRPSQFRTTPVTGSLSNQPQAPAAEHVPAPVREPSLLASQARRPRRRTRRVLTARASTGDLPRPEPLTIKLVTDNPQVVIYWQVD